jgi:DNA end-binding protein Ku
MTDPRALKADDVFYEALALPAEKRNAYIEGKCAGDAALAGEVRTLLSCHREEDAGFLDPAAIPVSYFETPYYLLPGPEGEHAYALVREALRRSRRAGLGRVVLRTREHLGALLPEGDFLVFNTLRFPQELRRPQVPETLAHARPASSEELMMAERLIREMEGPWSPESYQDRYREELLAYVRRKAEAGEARRVYEPEPEAEPVSEPPGRDLTDLLRRSLDEGEGPRGARKRRSAS